MHPIDDPRKCPDGWTLSTVGESCVICDQLRKPINVPERATIQGPYPYYGPTGVLDHINEFRVEGTYALIGEDGDHFLKFWNWSMTQLVEGRFNVNNHAHIVKGGSGCLTEWFHLYFHHMCLRPYLTLQGVGRYKLTRQSLDRLPIALPPLEEQRSIARIVAVWDRSIRQLVDLIAAKVRFKQGLMQQLLTSQRRFPEFIQQPWIRVKLGELLQEVERYVEWDDDVEYRLVSIRRRSGGMFFRESKCGRDIKTQVMKTTLAGDFVVARMQAVHGAMTVTPTEFDGFNVSDSYSTLVCRPKAKLHMPFLKYLSQTQGFYHLAILSAYGVTIEKMTFNMRWFLAESIELPPTVEEQEKISSVLDAADKEIRVLLEVCELLKEQKKGLMQKLLTGEVRVKEKANG